MLTFQEIKIVSHLKAIVYIIIVVGLYGVYVFMLLASWL